MSKAVEHQFQAEIQQLLDIVVHSLYTDKEIFIRELVSNASDALEKLRFHQTAGHEVYSPELELKIQLEVDEKARTFTITDTGIGMTQDEMVENLGMIAHSGSRKFLEQLSEGKKPDATLIGQFGVGFYSSFMVAEKVEVFSRSYRPDVSGCRWSSQGAGTYEIESVEDLPRGTKVVVHLKEEDKEYANEWTVERMVRRYSNFVSFPIELGDKRVNTIQAIWARKKSEIKEEEYKEFYQYIGHAHDEPRYRLHFSADAPLAIQALLFVPQSNLEKFGMARTEPGVNLHCKRVLIQSQSKGLLPEWMRFLKGVVDSEDLPLNISRETMQDSALVQKLNQVITKRFLKFLEEEARKDPEKYQAFFAEFGRFLKEGVVTDYAHKDALGKLLRYESSALDQGQVTSLEEYVTRMVSDQSEIYFMLAPSRQAVESSPYYEVFRARQFEVLFLYDPWDEFVMEHLTEFDGKKIISAEKAELKLEAPADKEGRLDPDACSGLGEWLKGVLGDRIEEVRPSERLVDSPAVLVNKDSMTASMRLMMQQMNPQGSPEKFALEFNPAHPLIRKLNTAREATPDLATAVAEQLFDNARAAAGVLEDPRLMVQRLNRLMEQVLERKE